MRLAILLCSLVLTLPQATGPKPLTSADREAAVKYLEQTSGDFVNAIKAVSDAQWTFKASPDRWSIAETAEHIALSESLIRGLVTDKILKGTPIPADAPARPDDQKIIAMITDRTQKAQAPEALRPTNRWATRDALLKDFLAERQKTIDYVKTTKDELRQYGAPHPALKTTLDGYQWILLLSAHSARHTAQIEEVKTSSGYPATR